MKIAITGGKGFIGSHVAAYAERAGHDVMFYDKRSGYDILGPAEMLDEGLAGADAVIHLAGVLGTMELFDTIEDAVMANTVGSLRIAQWCLANDAQYTGILVPDVFPSVYCATKVGAQRLTSALHHAKGLRVSHVTAYNAFGPGQAYGPGHPRKFGPTFSVYAHNRAGIPIWGDGQNLIDPTPVPVVARMLVDATQHGDDVVFDGGIGIEVTVTQIADLVAAFAGSDVPHAYEPMRIGETPTNVAATGRGWDRLDWDPADSIDGWQEYLAETVEWYRGVPLDGEVVSGDRAFTVAP